MLRIGLTVAFALAVSAIQSCRSEAVGVEIGGQVFVADWDQGLGTSSQAFTDAGQFVDWGGNGGNFEVRSTAPDGRAFSTPNYLRISASGGGWVDMTSRNWATPQVGQTITATWEITWNTSVSGQTTHGFYFDDDFGGVNWGPQTLGLSIEDSGNNWRAMVWTGGDPFVGGMRVGTTYPLVKGERYDFALSYTRTQDGAYTVGFEISQNGTVLFDSADFCDREWYTGSRCLSTQTFTQSGAGAQGMRGFRLGNNGLDTPFTGIIAEVANLRVTIR